MKKKSRKKPRKASNKGSGAIAQDGSIAAGAGGVAVGGNVGGNIIINPQPEKPAQAPPLSDKFQLARLPQTDARLFGREEELNLLDRVWQEEDTNVLVLTAFGGMGKTALMQVWLDEKRYAGADAVYTWSFYSQGTSEDRQASAAEFFDNALSWFGHDGSPLHSEHDRGLKLAELVCRQRTLLVLDGLEPLQYPLGGAMNGALRDKGLLCLCRQLAANNANNNGLLLISSRQPVQELTGRPGVEQHELDPLSQAAGIALFRESGIIGTGKELAATVQAYHGHALSLSLLATYLREYEDGDIRKQDGLCCLIEFPEETRTSRHAFRVMAAYERQLADSADVQVLYSLGLFDRPVSSGAMACLRGSGIPQVGGPPNDKVFHAACNRLRRLGLLNKEAAEHPGNLDCHPLVRQYFGRRLEELHPASWQRAHARLYEYFKALPEKELPDTLDEMEPLFAAVRHGCAAGMHQEVLFKVYWTRIRRGDKVYLCKKLCGFDAELSILSHFFIKPWCTPAIELTNNTKENLFGWVGHDLRALSRFKEAIQSIQEAIDIAMKEKDWINAAIAKNNLGELLLTIGKVTLGSETARQSVQLADTSLSQEHHWWIINNNPNTLANVWQMSTRTTLADALHQSGDLCMAATIFIEAEKLQQQRQPVYGFLYSIWGFRFCDLLLTVGRWDMVKLRTEYSLVIVLNRSENSLDISLNRISMSRAKLQKTIIEQINLLSDPSDSGLAPDLSCIPRPIRKKATADNSSIENENQTKEWLDQAVSGLRKAGAEEFIPRGLLSRAAWCRWAIVLLGRTDTITQAVQDVQETEEIAQRGGMRLHLIDFHLESARLALTIGKPVLNRTVAEHLAAAQKGIEETGYNRRLPEVANIEEVISTVAPA